MDTPSNVAAYAALAALGYFVLSIRVIGARGRIGVGLGDGGDESLTRRIRAHANFAEYVPITLVLAALAEAGGAPEWSIHAIGLSLLAGRASHAAAFSRTPEPPIGRVVGMALTFGALLFGAAACLYVAFG